MLISEFSLNMYIYKNSLYLYVYIKFNGNYNYTENYTLKSGGRYSSNWDLWSFCHLFVITFNK